MTHTEVTGARLRPLKVFISYSHADDVHRVLLGKHLAPLVHERRVELWHDRKIEPGQEWGPVIDAHLEEAELILLLISADFMASNYCWQLEMRRAMERHREGSARVIPLFLRPTYFKETPIGALQGLPRDAKPVEEWPSLDQAYSHIVEELSRVITGWEQDGRAPPGAPTHAFERERYLRSFIQRMERFDNDAQFLADSFVEPAKDIAAAEVDLSADLAQELPLLASGSWLQWRSVKQTRESFSALLSHGRAARILAVLGEPGSGKSLLLRRLGRELANEALGNPQAPIPGYFSLGAYTQSEAGGPLSIVEFIRTLIANGVEAERGLAPELRDALVDGRLVLLLDGMDEMPRSDFATRVAQLRELASSYPRLRLILTCRTNDFPKALFNVQQVRLVPFGIHEVRQYLARALKLSPEEASALTKSLRAPDSTLAGLVSNPFFLTLVARYYKNWNTLPESRATLFQGFIEPHLRRALARRPGLQTREVMQALGRLSLAMLSGAHGGVGTAVPFSDLLLRSGLEAQPGALLVDIGQEAGLLKRDEATGALRFFHPRIQEFFAALALEALEPAARERWLKESLDNPWLQEIFVLVAQRGVELAGFFQSVLDDTEYALLGPAPPVDDYPQMARLILLGRMLEVSSSPRLASVIPRMAALLEQLMGAAPSQSLPELRRIRVMRAIRGPLASVPRLNRILDDALRSAQDWERQEAFKALAPLVGTQPSMRQQLAAYVRDESISGNYLLSFPKLRAAAFDEPRLRFLREELRWGLLRYLGLLAGALGLWVVLSCIVAADASVWPFALGWAGGFFLLDQWSSYTYRRPGAGLGMLAAADGLLASGILTWSLTSLLAELLHRMLHPGLLQGDVLLRLRALHLRFSADMGGMIILGALLVVAILRVGFQQGLSAPRVAAVGAGTALALLMVWSMPQGALSTGQLLWIGGAVAVVAGTASWKLKEWSAAIGRALVALLVIGLFTGIFLLGIARFGPWMEQHLQELQGTAPQGVIAVGAFLGICLGVFLALIAFRSRAYKEGLLAGFLAILALGLVMQGGAIFFASTGEVGAWLLDAAQLIAVSLAVIGGLLLAAVVIFVGPVSFILSNIKGQRMASAPDAPLALGDAGHALEVLMASRTLMRLRRAMVEKLGMVEPPSEVIAAALVEYANSEKLEVDREVVARAVDSLQQRLGREAHRSPKERLARELPVLALFKDEPLYWAACLEWLSRVGLEPEVLAELEKDEQLGQRFLEACEMFSKKLEGLQKPE